jgi:hypothetical protein
MKMLLSLFAILAFICGNLPAAETTPLHAAASDRVSARPELVITTLGCGSCARQDRPQPIWGSVNATRCDAFVLLGDNISSLRLEVCGLEGEVVISRDLPFSELRPK